MSMKLRLSFMNFMQFFIFGSWLVTFSAYAAKVLNFSGVQIGAIYGTIGIASIFMPTIVGCVADRWFSAEKVYATCHFMGAIMLVVASLIHNPTVLFWVFLIYAMCYMPTIPLAGALCFRIISDNQQDTVKLYPILRVWGTVGFIVALWVISFLGLELSSGQLQIAGGGALLLAIYALFLPSCPPLADSSSKTTWLVKLGLESLVLFKTPRMAFFFLFSILIGVLLQINLTYVGVFLHDFSAISIYQNSFGVTHSAVLMSLAQFSEVIFILAIPFFLGKFGIKKIMLVSISAWVIRFGLLAYGNPGGGILLLLISMLVYGCAFDFFNISCAIFVDNETPQQLRASAQGLFFIMTLGIGGFAGSFGGGLVLDAMSQVDPSGMVLRNWHAIWLIFAGYALVLAVIFGVLFRPQATKN